MSKMARGKTESEIKLLIQENSKPQYLIVYTDGSVTKHQWGWVTVKQGATTIHEDSAAYTISTSKSTMKVEAVTHALRWIASRGDSRTHMSSHSQIQWVCFKKWKVEWEAQTGMWQWSASTFKSSCGWTALDMPEWREMTEEINWLSKQPSQVVCFSEDLKCWEAWDTTCGLKAKDVTPSITWRREAWKEEALDDLP